MVRNGEAFSEWLAFSDWAWKLYIKKTFTANFLNIRTPKQFVVITLKVEQDGFSLE